MQGMEKINDQFYVDRTKELGKGNFGVVYKGFYSSQNKIIAVKFMDTLMLKKNPDYQREIDVMKDLAKVSHPNIMGYYGFQKTKSGIFVFLQFCGGGSLKQLSKKKISQMKVMTLFKQFLQAMTYINKLNKVHRDLKPDNLMLDQNLQLKIADFGLARDIAILMTKGACTPLYAAPQVIALEQYDQRCDVWSAGMILYQMLTGKQMFAHVKTKQQLSSQLQKFKNNQKKIGYSKELHPQWQIITMKMLTYNKSKRPTFEQMLKYFQSIIEGMEKDLIQKYGYQKTQDDALRRTKKISPYQSDPNNKIKGLDMLTKLKEQQSFNKLNNVRKYLNFFRMKTDFMNKLIKQFTTNQYTTLKNVYKYAMMFLSVSTYISRLKQNLKEIKARKITTPDGVISDNQLQKIHEGQWVSLLRDFNQKHQNNIVKFQKVLETQIIAKITGSYMKRQQQKKILSSYKNLIGWIEDAQKGNYLASNQYMKMFIQIMNNKQVYSSQKQLKQMSHSDVKTYTYMRCVGNMNLIFPQKQYQNEDYIRIIRQEIQNMNKEDLIYFLGKINSK